MKGCIALTEEQITKVIPLLSIRDRAWFVLGLKTGLRISEILSLNISNISDDFTYIKVNKGYIKNKTESRVIPLHPIARKYLTDWLMISRKTMLNGVVFASRKGTKPLDRHSASRVLREAFRQAGIDGLPGQLGTHTMRKSFARDKYQYFQYDLIRTKEILGHKSILNTIQYLGFMQEDVNGGFLCD